MSSKKGKVENLPKWAQDRIELLETNLEYFKKALEVYNRKGEGPIIIDRHSDCPMRLPSRADISFETKNGGYFTVALRDEQLKIYSTHRIAVMPDAANVVTIKEEL